MIKTNAIDALLKFDGLDYAEKLTGQSYKTDEQTELLGFGLIMENNRIKNAALEKMGDTTMSSTLVRYLEIIEANGFVQALADPFVGPAIGHHDEDKEETYFVYARPDGLLLAFDTYGGKHVNGGKVWYNWMPESWDPFPYSLTSSGCRETAIFEGSEVKFYSGDHDCREALIHNMTRLEENGRFLSPWPKSPRLWLASYADWKVDSGRRYPDSTKYVEQITSDRISRLPAWVQEMIGRTS